MRKLTAFVHVTLDGFYCDAKGDMSWAHRGTDNPEWNAFVAGNAQGGGALVFGRVTYRMMESYWPSEMARQQMPVVAERMNAASKYVVSRKLKSAQWNNTKVVHDLVSGFKKLKRERGSDMVVLGSGSIVAQLLVAGLLDGLQVVVNPLVLGGGKALFARVKKEVPLKLTNSRSFTNGKVLLDYAPAIASR